MTSSNRKSSVVVELCGDNSVHVSTTFWLQPFNTDWIESSNWPEKLTWTNDNYEEFGCKLLHINTKQECEEFAKAYLASREKEQAFENSSNGEIELRMDSLDERMSKMEKMLSKLELKLTAFEEVLVPKPTMRQVGSTKMDVPLNWVAEAQVQGFDAGTFMILASRFFGKESFKGQTWARLDKHRQLEIQELLAFFVLYYLSREKDGKPKPSELIAHYRDIYDKFTTKLNNDKHTDKKRKNSNGSRCKISNRSLVINETPTPRSSKKKTKTDVKIIDLLKSVESNENKGDDNPKEFDDMADYEFS